MTVSALGGFSPVAAASMKSSAKPSGMMTIRSTQFEATACCRVSLASSTFTSSLESDRYVRIDDAMPPLSESRSMTATRILAGSNAAAAESDVPDSINQLIDSIMMPTNTR